MYLENHPKLEPSFEIGFQSTSAEISEFKKLLLQLLIYFCE